MEEIEYEEEIDCGIIGVLFKGRTVPVLTIENARTSIGNSTQILAFLSGTYPNSLILNHSGCFSSKQYNNKELENKKQEVIDLCKDFDKMGTAIQASMYGRLLGAHGFKIHRDTVLKLWGNDTNFTNLTPLWQRLLLQITWPLLRLFVYYAFKLYDPDTIQRTDKLIYDMFAKVSSRISDGRRFLLGGDCPTLADITFCSITGPLLLAPQYGGFSRSKTLYEEVQNISDVIHFVDLHRNTPAGQWVLNMYSNHRPLRSAK
ncbi:hypothetical protein G6F47_012835 [Rhizopus delemar]|nr:hypothetical protein G6F47_012835 [Rhizopus delemar]